MVYDGDRLARGGSDFIISTFKIDGLVVVDLARSAHREVQIEQAGHGCRSDSTIVFQQCLVPYFHRYLAGAALFGAVLAGDFHLENLLRMVVGFDFGMRQKCDHTVLKGCEAPFDFSFSLGRRCDEVSNAKPAQSSLKLTFWIAVITAGTGSKEAQAVGVDGFGQAVGFKSEAKVLEVIPCGLGGNEGACDDVAGVVVNGEQEILFIGR